MIALRAKKLSNGQFHLFIDSYEDGKRRKEYLKIYDQKTTHNRKKTKMGKFYTMKKENQNSKNQDEDKVSWGLPIKYALNRKQSDTYNYGFDDKIKKE